MDEELHILKVAALPGGLDALDERVLGALAGRQREAAAMRRMMALAAFVSLGGGVIAGSLLPRPAVAASALGPLVPAGPLAPSTLLDSR